MKIILSDNILIHMYIAVLFNGQGAPQPHRACSCLKILKSKCFTVSAKLSATYMYCYI